jgi:hypothetical protein
MKLTVKVRCSTFIKMPDEAPYSKVTIDVKGLSEPITKLVECVSRGIGNLYEPIGKIRDAKASAQAGLILAQGDIDKKELLARAAHRLAYTETRRQGVIEAVTEEAKKYLPETVSREPVSEDWIVQFFDNCKDIGEPEMRNLWARILAGEVANPGTFSRRTLQILKTFDREDAEAFTRYCAVSFSHTMARHFTFQTKATNKTLNQDSNDWGFEAHLASIGLLEAENVMYGASFLDQWEISYFSQTYKISAPTLPEFAEKDRPIFVRFFTAVGEELVKIVSASPIPNFVEIQAKELSSWLIKLESHR